MRGAKRGASHLETPTGTDIFIFSFFPFFLAHLAPNLVLLPLLLHVRFSANFMSFPLCFLLGGGHSFLKLQSPFPEQPFINQWNTVQVCSCLL